MDIDIHPLFCFLAELFLTIPPRYTCRFRNQRGSCSYLLHYNKYSWAQVNSALQRDLSLWSTETVSIWAERSGDIVRFPLQQNPKTHLLRAKTYGEPMEKAAQGCHRWQPQMLKVSWNLISDKLMQRLVFSHLRGERKNDPILSQIFPQGSPADQWQSDSFPVKS